MNKVFDCVVVVVCIFDSVHFLILSIAVFSFVFGNRLKCVCESVTQIHFSVCVCAVFFFFFELVNNNKKVDVLKIRVCVCVFHSADLEWKRTKRATTQKKNRLNWNIVVFNIFFHCRKKKKSVFQFGVFFSTFELYTYFARLSKYSFVIFEAASEKRDKNERRKSRLSICLSLRDIQKTIRLKKS